MFQCHSMRYIETYGPGIKRYRYKTYSVCSSIMPPRSALEMHVRCVSICDHTGKNEIPKDDLVGILEYCGVDLNRPISRQTVKHIGAPMMGDSQYYIQTVYNSAQ